MYTVFQQLVHKRIIACAPRRAFFYAIRNRKYRTKMINIYKPFNNSILGEKDRKTSRENFALLKKQAKGVIRVQDLPYGTWKD